MQIFAKELAAFLRRHYPDVIREDGWYRFSTDIQLKEGEVEVQIPMLTKLYDGPGPDAERNR